MDMRHYKTYVQMGLNIMYYRRQQGLTQEGLAEMVGITQQHLQRIETARSTPSLPTCWTSPKRWRSRSRSCLTSGNRPRG